MTLIDAANGAVNIADDNGVNIAKSLLKAQFEDADATLTPTSSTSAAELASAASPAAELASVASPVADLISAALPSPSPVVVDPVTAAAPAAVESVSVPEAANATSAVAAAVSSATATVFSIPAVSAPDFQLPTSLVGFCPKLSINVPKSFDLSEVNSPVSFYVSLHEHEKEVEDVEECLAKADTFGVLEV